MSLKTIQIIKSKNENAYDAQKIMLVPNEDLNDLKSLLHFADQTFKSQNIEILISRKLLDKCKNEMIPYPIHTFSYSTLNDIIKYFALMYRLRGCHKLHVVSYRENDSPFQNQIGMELMSLALNPDHIAALFPSKVEYYIIRFGTIALIWNVSVLFLKFLITLLLAFLSSALILVVALATQPFVYYNRLRNRK